MTRSDLAAVQGDQVALGPLERVVQRQRDLILQQAAAILDLRQVRLHTSTRPRGL